MLSTGKELESHFLLSKHIFPRHKDFKLPFIT